MMRSGGLNSNCRQMPNVVEEERLIDRIRRLPARNRKGVLTDFLRGLLASALMVEPSQVGLQDRLMDLGIDSLKAVELKLTVELQLGLELSSSLLFDYPTVDRLADFLVSGADVRYGGLETVCELKADVVMGIGRVCGRGDMSEESLAKLLAAELDDLRRNPRGAGK